MTSNLRILPLGGLGEIGKNMTVLEYEDDILIVDAGVMFPENDMLGVDLIIPDYHYLMAASLVVLLPILVTYVVAQRYFVQGIVMSGMKG